MTYGWAILAVLVVLGILFFSGNIADTSLFLPEECEFYITVICFDHLVKQDEIQLSIVNAGDRELIVKNIIADSDSLNGQCELAGLHRGKRLKDGEKFLFDLNLTNKATIDQINADPPESAGISWNLLDGEVLLARAESGNQQEDQGTYEDALELYNNVNKIIDDAFDAGEIESVHQFWWAEEGYGDYFSSSDFRRPTTGELLLPFKQTAVIPWFDNIIAFYDATLYVAGAVGSAVDSIVQLYTVRVADAGRAKGAMLVADFYSLGITQVARSRFLEAVDQINSSAVGETPEQVAQNIAAEVSRQLSLNDPFIQYRMAGARDIEDEIARLFSVSYPNGNLDVRAVISGNGAFGWEANIFSIGGQFCSDERGEYVCVQIPTVISQWGSVDDGPGLIAGFASCALVKHSSKILRINYHRPPGEMLPEAPIFPLDVPPLPDEPRPPANGNAMARELSDYADEIINAVNAAVEDVSSNAFSQSAASSAANAYLTSDRFRNVDRSINHLKVYADYSLCNQVPTRYVDEIAREDLQYYPVNPYPDVLTTGEYLSWLYDPGMTAEDVASAAAQVVADAATGPSPVASAEAKANEIKDAVAFVLNNQVERGGFANVFGGRQLILDIELVDPEAYYDPRYKEYYYAAAVDYIVKEVYHAIDFTADPFFALGNDKFIITDTDSLLRAVGLVARDYGLYGDASDRAYSSSLISISEAANNSLPTPEIVREIAENAANSEYGVYSSLNFDEVSEIRATAILIANSAIPGDVDDAFTYHDAISNVGSTTQQIMSDVTSFRTAAEAIRDFLINWAAPKPPVLKIVSPSANSQSPLAFDFELEVTAEDGYFPPIGLGIEVEISDSDTIISLFFDYRLFQSIGEDKWKAVIHLSEASHFGTLRPYPDADLTIDLKATVKDSRNYKASDTVTNIFIPSNFPPVIESFNLLSMDHKMTRDSETYYTEFVVEVIARDPDGNVNEISLDLPLDLNLHLNPDSAGVVTDLSNVLESQVFFLPYGYLEGEYADLAALKPVTPALALGQPCIPSGSDCTTKFEILLIKPIDDTSILTDTSIILHARATDDDSANTDPPRAMKVLIPAESIPGCQHVDLGTKRNSYDLKLIYAWANSPNINHVITGKLVANSPD